jgi:hypothetical protein
MSETDSNDEREARADYLRHVSACRKSGVPPEPLDRFLQEWISVRRVSLRTDSAAGEEPDRYGGRDYLSRYGGRSRSEQI